VTFAPGELFERWYETPDGTLDVLAEVVVDGSRLELRDIAVYPRSADRLDVRAERLLGWLRELENEARSAGFAELRITGTRLSGARPGRRVDVTIRLRGELP
jgi:hypothetical protein